MKQKIEDVASFMVERNSKIVSFGGKLEDLQTALEELDKQYPELVKQMETMQQEKPSYNLSLVYDKQHYNFFLPKSWFDAESETDFEQVEGFYQRGEFPISKLINPPLEDKIVLDTIGAIEVAKQSDERLGWLFKAIVVHLMLLVKSTSDEEQFPNYIAITKEEEDKLQSHIKSLPPHPTESASFAGSNREADSTSDAPSFMDSASVKKKPEYPH